MAVQNRGKLFFCFLKTNFNKLRVLFTILFYRFEIVADNDLDQPLVGSSPDECHSLLLSAISSALCAIPPKGAEFFGISHPTIQNLIQSSPGTRKLALYKSQRFEVNFLSSFYFILKN